MIAVIQRITRRVTVAGESVGKIGHGYLRWSRSNGAIRKLKRPVGRAYFGLSDLADAEDKMNLNVMDVGGGVLLVSQFTLAADTRGCVEFTPPPILRPETSVDYFVEKVRTRHSPVETGRFGAICRSNSSMTDR